MVLLVRLFFLVYQREPSTPFFYSTVQLVRERHLLLKEFERVSDNDDDGSGSGSSCNPSDCFKYPFFSFSSLTLLCVQKVFFTSCYTAWVFIWFRLILMSLDEPVLLYY